MSVSSTDPALPRVVRCGGVAKSDLLERLARAGVELNDYARILFGSEGFVPSGEAFTASIVETSPAGLGLTTRMTLPRIVDAAIARGWRPCPLELGPHLRLQYPDQAERPTDQPQRRHQAPLGSLTVVSAPLVDEDDFPKGFYLRRIDGKPWLRGYICSMQYEWQPDDRLVFRAD
jgi:hypothetical protein